MKTDSLIDLLARGAGPAPRAVAARRLWPAATGGGLVAGALALALLGSIPAAAYATSAPWMKFAYSVALAASAGWLAARLARPAARASVPARAVGGVFAAMAALGAATLVAAPAEARLADLMGRSWLSCPATVLALSLPALAAALWALRGLAPVRPRAAGFAAGLLAGAAGAAGYSLSCPESSPAFVATWYSLGIVLTGGLGAALGPRLLRW